MTALFGQPRNWHGAAGQSIFFLSSLRRGQGFLCRPRSTCADASRPDASRCKRAGNASGVAPRWRRHRKKEEGSISRRQWSKNTGTLRQNPWSPQFPGQAFRQTSGSASTQSSPSLVPFSCAVSQILRGCLFGNRVSIGCNSHTTRRCQRRGEGGRSHPGSGDFRTAFGGTGKNLGVRRLEQCKAA